MTAKQYQDQVLNGSLHDFYQEMSEECGIVVFQEDGAPSHHTKSTCELGHSTGSGITKVPGGNPQKYLQVNTPVHAGSQHLNTHADGDGHLSLKNPPNLQVPLRNYLIWYFHLYGCHKPIYRYLRVSPVTDGGDSLGEKNTCRYHPRGPRAMPYQRTSTLM